MYAFIHIPRTAGSTVRWMLYSTFGIRHANVEPWAHRPRGVLNWMFPLTPDDLHRIQRIHPPLRSIAGHVIRPFANLEAVQPEINYFTFLRDPVAHVVSTYRFNVAMGWRHGTLPFETFVRRHVDNPQTIRLCGETNADAAIQMIQDKRIFAGLTETFDESMLLLKARMMSELNLGYRRINVLPSKQVPANQITDEAIRQLVMEKTQADQALYDFAKSELLETYRADYGPDLRRDLTEYQAQRGGFNRFNVVTCRAYRYLIGKPARKVYRWMNKP